MIKLLKPALPKKQSKQAKELKILLGLVDYFLKTGKPVGSNTLKEAGFEDFSSATIRNYFVNLEKEGYLTQQHTSGGRIPTSKAFRVYAQDYVSLEISDSIPDDPLYTSLRNAETRELTSYLQNAAESLSQLSNTAVFLSAPRFDNDFIVEVKLVPIDQARCLCVIITDFGVILTEILPTEKKLSAFTVKRLESYFHWRLTGNDKPDNLDPEEEQLAHRFYSELMVRYIVSYSNFSDEDIYRTGFSKLLTYPEFQNPASLASSLSLFENAHSMRLLLKECSSIAHLKFWIGDDLLSFTQETPNCSVLAMPYFIHQQPVGAIGLLGPMRIPYRELFDLLRVFSNCISTALTRNIFKHKITFRQPRSETPYLQKEEQYLIGQTRTILLENKSY
jgi:heat-inducible transcriptional repressor